nr:UbiA family prenyltransferase [Qipengyuania proteolytica]
MRLYQWPKNTLVFVPLLVSHAFTLEDFLDALVAFFSFSLLASATYLFNDLRDIRSDRMHRIKSQRPIASGALSERAAMSCAIALLLFASALTLLLPHGFAVVLAIYLVTTLGYTLLFKRMLGLDIVVIACLYTLRVVAGDEAIGADLAGLDSSDWILGFSCLLFLALALIKRCSELFTSLLDGHEQLPGRAYREEDIPILLALATGASMCSIAIFVRFIGSSDVTDNFSDPRLLWLMVPILVYWLMRLLLLANRKMIVDDPVLFTLRDAHSRWCGVGMTLVTLAAW